jgi:hypothetical protein
MGRTCSTHGREYESWQENLKKTTTKKTRCRWKHNIKRKRRKIGCGVWAGFIRPRVEISGGLL